MRRNKSDRHGKHKCKYSKCPNTGVTGLYFRGNSYYCSKNCYRKANPRKKDPNIIKVSSGTIAKLRGLIE